MRNVVLAAMLCLPCLLAAQEVRTRVSLDKGWRFALGHAADPDRDFGYGLGEPYAKTGDVSGALARTFDDAAWRAVDLPHDWAVELPFVNTAEEEIKDHGYKPVGGHFPESSIGWYRRTLPVSAGDEGRRLTLVFDGVYRDCAVWLNGHFLKRNLSGYTGFRVDVTDCLDYGGRNVLVVRADARHSEGWFYEGAGIYRHVWLEKTSRLHVAPQGLILRARPTRDGSVTDLSVRVLNQGAGPAAFTFSASFFDPDGRPVASVRDQPGGELAPRGETTVSASASWPGPRLWSLESPALYRAVVEIRAGGAVVDRVESTFGIRSIRFDPDRGFLLNGRRVQIQGVCCHQDHAGVGSAVPDALLAWRLRELKTWGVNAYRTSHHAPAPELLDLCDRMGILVLDENRMLGSSEEVLGQLGALVERDRNHPCVIAWGLGNEEGVVQTKPQGGRFGEAMKGLVRDLDPTRPVTFASNAGNADTGLPPILDVFGWNYTRLGDPDALRSRHPDWRQWGTEEASTLCTRGEYLDDPVRGYLSAYDLRAPKWGKTAQQSLSFFGERSWLAGAFVWTGFDYRGEPTPYGWPCISSHFGILDTCGFPKDNAYYYKAHWTREPALHLLPHWTWPGREGGEVQVRALTNCDAVELFVNGKSAGRRTVAPYAQPAWNVIYHPGALSAKGWKNGKLVRETRVETTGAPAAVRLVKDREAYRADGADVAVIRVEIVDAAGRVVPFAGPFAGPKVRFRLAGAGRILGVGNGDPSCHEPDGADPRGTPGNWQRSAFHGLAQILLQAPDTPSVLTLTAEADGLVPGTLSLEARAPAPI